MEQNEKKFLKCKHDYYATVGTDGSTHIIARVCRACGLYEVLDIEYDADENGHILRHIPYYIGEKIGEGLYRKVFVHNNNPELVIKYEENGFNNIKEWEIWQELQHWTNKVPLFFAPCVDISPDGRYLIQKRTLPATHEEYPQYVPPFLFDRKYSNYGKYDGRIVCHDYAGFSLCNGYDLHELVESDWRDE